MTPARRRCGESDPLNALNRNVGEIVRAAVDCDIVDVAHKVGRRALCTTLVTKRRSAPCERDTGRRDYRHELPHLSSVMVRPECPFPATLEIVPPMEQGRVAIGVPVDMPFTEVNRLIETQ